jgi:beta-ribofuranosylaminobenzene 5'-phosphate synthase
MSYPKVKCIRSASQETELLQVRTGSRLHFGLMELAAGEPLRYGGWGLMLSAPNLVLEFSRRRIAASQPAGDPEVLRRIDEVLALGKAKTGNSESGCFVRVIDSLPMHHGLGAGTQLAATTAAGLELVQQLSTHAQHPTSGSGWQSLSSTLAAITPGWLARHAGRGLRSAVGLHGFVHGGMILDEGYVEPVRGDDLSERPIVCHSQPLPTNWRVVLICPDTATAVSGRREAELLREIGQSPNPNKRHMLQLAQQAMANVAVGGDFNEWTSLLEEYMRLAAGVFAEHQGGTYNGAAVAEAAALAKKVKLRGVGQSSWGPTIFGFAADAAQAELSAEWLRRQKPSWTVTVTIPAAHGAQWRWLPTAVNNTEEKSTASPSNRGGACDSYAS